MFNFNLMAYERVGKMGVDYSSQYPVSGEMVSCTNSSRSHSLLPCCLVEA